LESRSSTQLSPHARPAFPEWPHSQSLPYTKRLLSTHTFKKKLPIEKKKGVGNVSNELCPSEAGKASAVILLV